MFFTLSVIKSFWYKKSLIKKYNKSFIKKSVIHMKNLKKYIPNILTASRLVFTPIVIFLGLTNHYKILIAVAMIIAFTDLIISSNFCF